MSALERELIDKITRLDADQQRLVLDFVERIETATQPKRYTARELLRLPPEERDRLIAAAFEMAATENFETFEA